jgi:hypothetical protein
VRIVLREGRANYSALRERLLAVHAGGDAALADRKGVRGDGEMVARLGARTGGRKRPNLGSGVK